MCASCPTHTSRNYRRWTSVVLLLLAVRSFVIIYAAPRGLHGLGGVFLAFADEISALDYRIPARIPYYSEGGLPFAYPPLAFYVVAILKDILSVPSIIAAESVLIAASVASLLLLSLAVLTIGLPASVVAGACVLYAAMPAAYVEHLEIAGLAEAFGSIAVIVFASSLARAYLRPVATRYILAGAAWALCILSSPGSIYGSVVMALVYAAVLLSEHHRSKAWSRYLGFLVAMGLVALGLSAPYWLTVVVRHGVGIFIRSFGAQHGDPAELLFGTIAGILRFSVAGGPLGFLTDALILAGVVWTFCHRRWWLIVWFLGFLVIPREGRWLVTVPAAILGGVGVSELFAVLGAHLGKAGRLLGFAVVATALMFNAVGTIIAAEASHDESLWTSAIDAMIWVRDHTPEDAAFVVLGDPYIREWVPYVAQRTVLNVWWGQEWEPEEQRIVGQLNEALEGCGDWMCICSEVTQTLGYVKFSILSEVASSSELPANAVEPVHFTSDWSNERFVVGSIRCARLGLVDPDWSLFTDELSVARDVQLCTD